MTPIEQARAYVAHNDDPIVVPLIRALLAEIDVRQKHLVRMSERDISQPITLVPDGEPEIRLTCGPASVAKRIPLLIADRSNVSEPGRYAEQCWIELSAALWPTK